MAAAGIEVEPLFRRVNACRYKTRPAVKGRALATLSVREAWDLRKTLARPAVPARVEYDVGEAALHPGSLGPIYWALIRRAYDHRGLPDLTADELARLFKGTTPTRPGRAQPGPIH